MAIAGRYILTDILRIPDICGARIDPSGRLRNGKSRQRKRHHAHLVHLLASAALSAALAVESCWPWTCNWPCRASPFRAG